MDKVPRQPLAQSRNASVDTIEMIDNDRTAVEIRYVRGSRRAVLAVLAQKQVAFVRGAHSMLDVPKREHTVQIPVAMPNVQGFLLPNLLKKTLARVRSLQQGGKPLPSDFHCKFLVGPPSARSLRLNLAANESPMKR